MMQDDDSAAALEMARAVVHSDDAWEASMHVTSRDAAAICRAFVEMVDRLSGVPKEGAHCEWRYENGKPVLGFYRNGEWLRITP